MRLIGSQYRETGAFFRKKLAFPTLFCTLFFFSVVFLSGWGFQQNQELLEQATEQIFTLFEGKNLEIEGHISPLLLLANNLIASAEGMLLGLIPFLFLPLVTLAINAAVIGGLGAYSIQLLGWRFILAGILPHGIFELPALLLAGAMGVRLCLEMIRWVLRKPCTHTFPELLMETARFFLLIVTPLLVLAGLAEGYLTPLVLELVMGGV